ERGQEHGLLSKTPWQRPRHSPLLSPQWSRVPPILPHRVPGHRPGKPSQPPCPLPRTHSYPARCSGLRPDAFAVRISRNRGRQTELLLPAAGPPERTLAQEALLRSRSQHNDRALLRAQVPHVPLFGFLHSACGYLLVRRSPTWHSVPFQAPPEGLWKSVCIGARDSVQGGETASYRTTTSALKFKIWHDHAE